MHIFYAYLAQLAALVRRERLHYIIGIVIFITLIGSVGFAYFEKDITFPDALWWSFVTLTTVGYGDISPASIGGRLVGILVMVSGIGFLGILTASIASIFVENKLLEAKGMKRADATDHIIICGWNFRGNKIIEELRADPKAKTVPIVIIADLPEKPSQDPLVHFIRGEVDAESLEKAAADKAKCAMILSDDRLDAHDKDARAVLNALTIESLYPEVYTCVELMEEKNVAHCERAKANEIVVIGELSTNMMVQAALDHGITRMISELVSHRYGQDIYKIAPPAEMVGKTFYEAMCGLKERWNILCVGVEKHDAGGFVANPDADLRINEGDRLIVIADERPAF